MGRSRIVKRYEITPEIKELQELSVKVRTIGIEVRVDITKDDVSFNNNRHMTYKEAKVEMLRILEDHKTSPGLLSFPDPEEVAREEKRQAKLARKNRKPGTPPELKTLVRRAKRIYKKTVIKLNNSADASLKAKSYIDRKGQNDIDKAKAHQILLDYINKEMSK